MNVLSSIRSSARPLCAAALLAAASACAHGTRRDSLPPTGARVRVTIPDSLRQDVFLPRARSFVGTLARATTDTLWLEIGTPDTVRVARATVRRLEVSRGASRVASALEQGVGFGVATGLLVHSLSDRADRRDHAWKIGLTAAGVAAIVGALRPFEQWRSVR